MAEVQFTNEAISDLSAIDEYSAAQFGEDVGEAYMRGFDEVFELLQDYPKAGAAAPQFGKSCRCFRHRSHRIFYVVEGDVVLIVRVLHHAVDTQRVLRSSPGGA